MLNKVNILYIKTVFGKISFYFNYFQKIYVFFNITFKCGSFFNNIDNVRGSEITDSSVEFMLDKPFPYIFSVCNAYKNQNILLYT